MSSLTRTLVLLFGIVVVSSRAGAEPLFLAKQYTRCTACHYSPTGGGLLTPYGRLLSHRELSTTGGETAPAPDATDAPHGEQAFLNGVLGDALGPVHLGLEMRPSHLRIGFPGGHQDLNLLMNLDLAGAVQKNGWTAYGTVGREPPHAAVRAGRTQSDPAFMSYGVRFADHTVYTRAPLDLDRNDQVYGIEVSDTVGSSLVQVMVSPGKAEAILHDRARRGVSAASRWQRDIGTRATIVGSALYRDRTDVDPRSGLAGGAVGFAPTSRVSIWTEVDGQLRTKTAGGHSWVVVNETSVEVYRGIWLKLSPQLRSSGSAGSAGSRRLGLAADLLPRTHWNVNVAYNLDRTARVTTSTLIFQLHLFM